MERRITTRGGAVAFIDDYTAWVVGKNAEENITGISEIVDHALAWELRSGATFEGEKTHKYTIQGTAGSKAPAQSILKALCYSLVRGRRFRKL